MYCPEPVSVEDARLLPSAFCTCFSDEVAYPKATVTCEECVDETGLPLSSDSGVPLFENCVNFCVGVTRVTLVYEVFTCVVVGLREENSSSICPPSGIEKLVSEVKRIYRTSLPSSLISNFTSKVLPGLVAVAVRFLYSSPGLIVTLVLLDVMIDIGSPSSCGSIVKSRVRVCHVASPSL